MYTRHIYERTWHGCARHFDKSRTEEKKKKTPKRCYIYDCERVFSTMLCMFTSRISYIRLTMCNVSKCERRCLSKRRITCARCFFYDRVALKARAIFVLVFLICFIICSNAVGLATAVAAQKKRCKTKMVPTHPSTVGICQHLLLKFKIYRKTNQSK